MPDLAQVLNELYSGGDMTIFQAVVDAVGTGVVTVHVNGGTFANVPYLQAGFLPASGPAVGDACYVIGRKRWGMLVIGKPAAGAARSAGNPQTHVWAPSVLTTWSVTASYPAGHFVVSGTGNLVTDPDSSTAVWFYATTGVTWPAGSALSTASIRLTGSWTQPGPIGPGNPARSQSFLTLGLHNSTSPTGTFTPIAELSRTYAVPATFDGLYAIPLDWASRLLAGTATGLYVASQDFPQTFTGSGELRLTTL